MKSVVVFAAGNDARGDDAIGPALLDWIEAQGWPQVRTVFDFQFQVEHALDLEGATLALFIDAHLAQPQPVRFAELRGTEGTLAGSHALNPAQVMGVHARLGSGPPPPAFVLSVAGERFALGEPMSARAEAAVSEAKTLLQSLLSSPALEVWRRLAGQ